MLSFDQQDNNQNVIIFNHKQFIINRINNSAKKYANTMLKTLMGLKFLITINCIIIIINFSECVNCEVKNQKEQLINHLIKRQSNNPSFGINRITSTLDTRNHINSSNLITLLRSLEIDETTIKVNWRLKVINNYNVTEQLRIKMKTDDQQNVYLPTEWTLRVRQFGTLYVKLRFISEVINYTKLLITGFSDISFKISSLNDGIAYELCLQSAEFPVHDQIETILRRVNLFNHQGEQEVDDQSTIDSKIVCKEVVTRRSTCGNTLTPGKIATVTVVSSASTIIIVVVVGWCWCPNNKTTDQQKDKNGHRSSNINDDDDDDESIGDDDEVNQPNSINNQSRKRNWFQWFHWRSSNITTDQHSNGNNQRTISKSLMVHNVNYQDTNDNYNVNKVKNWLTLWKKIKLADQPIAFNNNLETINIGIDCEPTSTTIYRPKSWPQDEWTIKGVN